MVWTDARSDSSVSKNLESSKKFFGTMHDHTQIVQRSLADALMRIGEGEESARLLEEVVQLSKQSFGPDHERTLRAENSYALALAAIDRNDEAISCSIESSPFAKERIRNRLPFCWSGTIERSP